MESSDEDDDSEQDDKHPANEEDDSEQEDNPAVLITHSGRVSRPNPRYQIMQENNKSKLTTNKHKKGRVRASGYTTENARIIRMIMTHMNGDTTKQAVQFVQMYSLTKELKNLVKKEEKQH